MGLLCCFSAPATAEEKPVINLSAKDVSDSDIRPSPRAAAEEKAPLPAQPAAQQRDVDKPWSKLNENESAAVKQTLLKVGLPQVGVPGCRVNVKQNCGCSSADATAPCHAPYTRPCTVQRSCQALGSSVVPNNQDQ